MTFFKPLRRKIGVLTLLLACVFAAGWVRSQFHYDFLEFGLSPINREVEVHSKGGSFAWIQIKCRPDFADPVSWWEYAHFLPTEVNFDQDPLLRFHLLHGWNWSGAHLASGHAVIHVQDQPLNVSRIYGDMTGLYVPYGFVVTPLTLLSAWLLLSKPKQRKTSTEQQANA